MPAFFSNDDRSQLRREITVAVLGIVIGALTTFANKFIETEYLFQRNLKVVEYHDSCKSVSDKELECVMNLRASGLKEIKKVHLTVVAADKLHAKLETTSLITAPDFAPPDPPPQFDMSGRDEGVLTVSLPRFRDPQGLSWTVHIVALSPVTGDDIQRVVSSDDPDVKIEEGGSWRWKRWVPIGIFGLLVPLAVAIVLLVLLWVFRPRQERKLFLWE